MPKFKTEKSVHGAPVSPIKDKTEHLIELVRDHINSRVSEHKDGQLIFNTWKSIAEILVVGKFGGKYKIYAPCILYIFTLKKCML